VNHATRDQAVSDDVVEILINGERQNVRRDSTVAAALLNAGVFTFRRSVGDTARAPLCGMGSCYECRVTIDGVPQQRACMTLVRSGMQVQTDA
jgi:sarcosine oxidase subunit alpha